MPAFTGGQMAQWLYQKHVTSIEAMTNLSKQNRQRLAEAYEVGYMLPADCQHSVDGTVKYLFPVRCGDMLPRAVRRNGVHSRRRKGHSVRVVSGGMQDELSVLPDGQARMAG